MNVSIVFFRFLFWCKLYYTLWNEFTPVIFQRICFVNQIQTSDNWLNTFIYDKRKPQKIYSLFLCRGVAQTESKIKMQGSVRRCEPWAARLRSSQLHMFLGKHQIVALRKTKSEILMLITRQAKQAGYNSWRDFFFLPT